MNRILSKPAYHFRDAQKKNSQPIIPGQSNNLWQYQILDPDGEIANRWNYIFLGTTIISLFIDPLYFYVPFTLGEAACMSLDKRSAVAITYLRTLFDFFYVLHMVVKFRTAFVAPSSRVFGRGELIMDTHAIANKYLKGDFVIDLAAMLPLPQIIVWMMMIYAENTSDHTNNTLALIVLIQYIPRLFVIFPLNKRIIKTTGVVVKTEWAGAAYNLLLYILASHIAGATWYLASVGRQASCWKGECKRERNALIPCVPLFLDCSSLFSKELGRDRNYWINTTHLLAYCDANNEKSDFKFGMFADAFTSRVSAAKFSDKALYGLWWGLRSLSSYGTNLQTSTYLGETSFCIMLCVAGLILFAQLIGNMQTYLSSMTLRVEEWRIKRRDTEEWMRHRQLPPDLQERIRGFVQYRWFATRGVNEESILWSFPTDLRREIQRHQCLNLVRGVPFFAQMDTILLDAICERLCSSLSTQSTFIVKEGDPVDEMLFIIRGKLESSTTNGGRSGFFNSITLGAGDFCGEELLTWALMPTSTVSLPSSTRTVCTLTEVEAFVLRSDDLRFVSSQFKHLHSKRLQHAFRYYSHQWRTWGACLLQNAWRRYRRKKLAMELALQENTYYVPLNDQDSVGSNEESETSEESGNKTGLHSTFLASKFAANTRRAINNQKVVVVGYGESSLKLPRLARPDEPDFSTLSSTGDDF